MVRHQQLNESISINMAARLGHPKTASPECPKIGSTYGLVFQKLSTSKEWARLTHWVQIWDFCDLLILEYCWPPFDNFYHSVFSFLIVSFRFGNIFICILLRYLPFQNRVIFHCTFNILLWCNPQAFKFTEIAFTDIYMALRGLLVRNWC